MLSKNNSKRLYYLIRFIGPVFFCVYLNKILHEIDVVFHRINVAFCEISYQISIFLLQVELIFFIIQSISAYLLVLALFKIWITPIINKFKIALLRKLKDKIDTLDKKNVNRIFFIYYFTTITSPTSTLCYFFWDEVCDEVFLNLLYFQFGLLNLEYFFRSFFNLWH